MDYNLSGQCGVGHRNNINDKIIQIKCGGYHSLIKRKGLKYYTFGDNDYKLHIYNNN